MRRFTAKTVWAVLGLALLSLLTGAAVLGVPAASADDPSGSGAFTVALWGDEPYASTGDLAKIPALVKDMNEANVAFTVFDGDTKDGSSQCTDKAIISDVRAIFDATDAPTIYVPGDNEWTDCHRTNNGSYNSLERLTAIRKGLFNTADSFGKKKMTLEHQGPLGGVYAENTRWVYNGVVFVGLNVPGSNNGKVNVGACEATNTKRQQPECDADNLEWQMRDAANISWLRHSFQMAKDMGAPGIMIVIQANMGFDIVETQINELTDVAYRARPDTGALDGFDNFIKALADETKAYKGQVVLVHGDTHVFRVDKTFLDQSHVLQNFTRVETFGSGNPHWVKATIDPNARNVFRFEPMMVPGN